MSRSMIIVIVVVFLNSLCFETVALAQYSGVDECNGNPCANAVPCRHCTGTWDDSLGRYAQSCDDSFNEHGVRIGDHTWATRVLGFCVSGFIRFADSGWRDVSVYSWNHASIFACHEPEP
jgi:hypothetical protein